MRLPSPRLALASCFALAALSAAAPAQWALINPTTSPSLRRAGAMAWHAPTNRLVIYGGMLPSPSQIIGEMWSFNGQWQQITNHPTMLPRWGHQMVRNPVTDRLVTFGGRSPTITGLANDTLEWTGSTWLVLPTPVSPSPRFLYGMSFDTRRNVVVMFGGRTAQQTVGETWEWNGVTWTQRTFALHPLPREEMVMVYDAALNRTVVFGGHNGNTGVIHGDTWMYDGDTWQQVTTTNGPTPRYRAAAVYDSFRKRTVMFGGFNGTEIVRETFEFSGSAWQQVTSGPNVPPNATEVYAGYDPTRRKFVVFGGFGGTFSNATWEYTGATTGLFGKFGRSCATPAGAPTLSGTTPTLGQTLTLTYGNLPLDCELVLAVLGVSNTTSQGLPLPFPLGIIGLPACELLVSVDYTDVRVTNNGTATLPVPIPNQVALLNAVLYAQGIALDLLPGGAAFLGSTAGARIVLGN